MKELTAKQLRNEVVNKLWNYGNLPKNIQEFMGDEVAFMLEIIDTKVKEQLRIGGVSQQSELLAFEGWVNKNTTTALKDGIKLALENYKKANCG